MNDVKKFAGTSNLSLATDVSSYLEMDLGKLQISRFKNREIYKYFEVNAL